MVDSQSQTLSRPEVYESQRIQLTSPLLHIGSAISQLNKFEYVQTANKVYLPDREALAKGLLQRGRLNDYIRTVEQGEEITDILIQAFGENWQEATDLQSNPIFPKHLVSQKWTEQKITDLRPMIRNGFGQLYIPGSSIKGAIRTAIAYHLLKHADRYQVPQQQRVSEIENKLRQTMGELKRSAKFADDRLFVNSLFSDFNLFYQEKQAPGKISLPNTDFMRSLKVTDSQPLLESKVRNKAGKPIPVNIPAVTEVIVSSRFPDYLAKYKTSIYTEIVRNVQVESTISLDTEMLSWFSHKQEMKLPFNNLDKLLEICQEFAQDQWEYEQAYWRDIKNNPRTNGKNLDFDSIRNFYESEKCPFSLRLGWGTGLNGTTVGLGLDEELRAEIRDTCGLKAPNFEAPKSRRTVVSPSGEIKYVPGWVKFKTM